MKIFMKALIAILLTFLMTGCWLDNDDLNTTIHNTAPIADAGEDQSINTGTTVVLDGSGSTDVDGDPLTYGWSIITVPPGSTVSLSDTTAVKPTFVPDEDGTYEFELVVNDGTVDSTPDSVSVMATTVLINSVPVANAGTDQSINTGTTVVLDGSGSSDVDGDPLTYSWSIITVPPGSTVSLSDTTAVKPTFVPDENGTYEIELVVNDGIVDSTPDSVSIVATTPSVNSAPVANAGIDQNVSTGSTVTLDGSGSSDVDGDPLTYSWSMTTKPLGSSAVLANANTVSPTFTADMDGDYVAQLIVNDTQVNSAPDTVTITSSPAGPITGVLDTSFNGTGYITHDNAAGGDSSADVGNGIAVDGVGNVYVTGSSISVSPDRDMVIWKYKSDGTLDPSFGTNGIVTDHNASGGDYIDEGHAIALDSSGNIYVVGGSRNTSSSNDMVIWKYKSDGTPDTTFGVNGIVTYPASAQSIAGEDIALDSEGNIYVTGVIRTDDNYMAIWKYDQTGSLDTSFDTDGVLLFDTIRSKGNGIKLDSNKNIYVTGTTLNSSNIRNRLTVWKFDNNGTADTTFSGDGIVTYDYASIASDYAEIGLDIALDSSNNIYITGYFMDFTNVPTRYYMCLLKYNSNGNLDPTFGNGGRVMNDRTAGILGRDWGRSVTWDSSGKVYVTGQSDSPTDGTEMVIWKYNDNDGSLDTSFDSDGIVIEHITAGIITDQGNDIALDNFGKVFVTGHSNYDMAIWKYK